MIAGADPVTSGRVAPSIWLAILGDVRLRRLTSLVVVFALSGTPVVAAACLWSCAPPATAVASAAPVSADSSAEVHRHHDADVSRAPQAPSAAGATIDGECHECCASTTATLDTGAHADRAAAVVTMPAPAAAAASREAWTDAWTGARSARPLFSPISPPSPPHPPLVLRI